MQHILKRSWQAWKLVGQKIGDFIARVVLSIFYFTVFVPFALGARLLSDPLNVKAGECSRRWLERETGDRTIEEVRRQF